MSLCLECTTTKRMAPTRQGSLASLKTFAHLLNTHYLMHSLGKQYHMLAEVSYNDGKTRDSRFL